jgi:hypothetical protein
MREEGFLSSRYGHDLIGYLELFQLPCDFGGLSLRTVRGALSMPQQKMKTAGILDDIAKTLK